MAELEVLPKAPPKVPPKGVPLENSKEEKKEKDKPTSPERLPLRDDRDRHAIPTASDPDPLSRRPLRQTYAKPSVM